MKPDTQVTYEIVDTNGNVKEDVTENVNDVKVGSEKNIKQPQTAEEVVSVDFDEIYKVKPAKTNLFEVDSRKLTTLKWTLWGLFLVVGFFLLLSFSVFDLWVTTKTIYQESKVYGWTVGGGSILFVLILFSLIYSEVRSYISIAKFDENREDFQSVIDRGVKKDLIKFIHGRALQQKQHPFSKECNALFFNSIKDHHSFEEVLNIYDTLVVSEIEKEAQSIVKKSAFQSIGATLVMPNKIFETLTVLWINAQLLRTVAKLYGLRPGFFGSLRLIKIVTENVLINHVSEEILNKTGEALLKEYAGSLLGTLSKRILMAGLSGALTSRLGNNLVSMCKIDVVQGG